MASILVCLVLLEVALRVYHAATEPPPDADSPAATPPSKAPAGTSQKPRAGPPPLHLTLDSPILYGMNPEHPDINSLGLRDDEISLSKPKGTLRILVLGDSVPYGPRIPRDKTFPNRLEQLLRNQFGSVEVINAGVQGYTAYNELQYYLTKGRELDPDIVIIAFCMNDVVNPRLHWGYFTERIFDIPDQAIPNHDYDKNHILPKMEHLRAARKVEKEKEKSLLARSLLYNAVTKRVSRLFEQDPTELPDEASETKPREYHQPRRGAPPNVPTFITGEDSISIEVLLDKASPEWKWLVSIYNQLRDAVRADRAIFMIAILPLAYQLDEGYPFFPQNQIIEYCDENAIPCIDLLPALKQHPKEEVFFLDKSGYNDIWHLTELGHEICAEELLRHLEEMVQYTSPVF